MDKAVIKWILLIISINIGEEGKIMNKKKKKIGSLIMASIISVATVAQTFSVSTFAYSSYERIAGVNRYETSKLVSNRNQSDTVVVASGENFADALSSVNLSNKYGASTILTNGNTDIINTLKARNVKKIFLVGGVNSIPQNLENKLKESFNDVERIAGVNRYETSRKTIKRTGYTKLGVASGKTFPDALSASALLKQEDYGLLLVDGDHSYTVPEGTTVEYTFGGSRTIVQNGGERINGTSRFETAVKISNMVKDPKSMAVVSGDNYADALSATNLVISEGAIVMPVQKYPYYDVIRKARQVDKVYFIGGENSVSNETASRIIQKGVGGIDKPSAGEDYDTDELTSDQQKLLDDIEERGKRIIDDIEKVEDAIDTLRNINWPSAQDFADRVEEIQDMIQKIRDDIKDLGDLDIGSPSDIINEIKDNLIDKLTSRLLDAIKKLIGIRR